ncbi:CRISPR-associated protein Cas4 [Methanorbis rubei]|uniref:PD-(D/E)XK endonuclease-like domain-containing protein n=1 Tax=Methanorbis rubei TaxID=3028300 RepID=A0AAE4SD11_9EURY|nr:hypothetical protein [Methanocorpusculaceae archaeon Cs1]
MTAPQITVSELVRCSVCPLQLYLARSDPAEFIEPHSYSIAKQIAAHLGGQLILEEIWDELKTVRPDAGDAEYSQLFSMIEACEKTDWQTALRADVIVSSKKYGITGRVDRLFDDGFAVVKSSEAPTTGIYANDRLRVTAYALCLEEEYDRPFIGTVEYLGSGTVRHQGPATPSDRRAFLAALRTAETIFQGKIPQPLRGRSCLSCRYHERCKETEHPKSLFEKLYHRR